MRALLLERHLDDHVSSSPGSFGRRVYALNPVRATFSCQGLGRCLGAFREKAGSTSFAVGNRAGGYGPIFSTV